MSPQVSIHLEPDLERRLSSAAQAHGASISALSLQWIIDGLERLEASQDPQTDGSGMCSVRTGLSGAGPRPLPLQQSIAPGSELQEDPPVSRDTHR